MNGRDFLPAARRMAASSEEADRRSAASRAYYAAFHATRDQLAALRFRTPRADRAHNYLYVRLNNCGIPTVEQAAVDLHDLRTLRNVADYDVGLTFAPQEAADAVDSAGGILRVLDALTPAELTHMIAAIRAYKQQIGDVTWQP